MRPANTDVAKFSVRLSDNDAVDVWIGTEQGVWVNKYAIKIEYHMEINTETQQFDTVVTAVFDSETYIKYRLMWLNEI